MCFQIFNVMIYMDIFTEITWLPDKQTPWPLVRERTIPTDRPPLVDEIMITRQRLKGFQTLNQIFLNWKIVWTYYYISSKCVLLSSFTFVMRVEVILQFIKQKQNKLHGP
jgi:hypothetical protein